LEKENNHICDYGCGNKAKYQMKNGKWCCYEIYTKCPAARKKNSESLKKIFKNPQNHPRFGTKHTQESINKMRDVKLGKKLTKEHKEKIGKSLVGKMAGKNNPMFGIKGENHHFYGKKHTQETKDKIGKANKTIRLGKNLSEEHKESIRKAMLGREIPQEWRDKISKANTGRKHSKETIEKLKLIARKGEDHHNWKGGISADPYCPLWLDKEFRQDINNRDNNKCQNPDCWNNTERMTIHHIDYNKQNCSPDNLITVCNSCNSRANFNREYWQELYTEIINNKKKELL
jgi:hypothetical protein